MQKITIWNYLSELYIGFGLNALFPYKMTIENSASEQKEIKSANN